ncbi:MAG: hypothetical protein ACLFTT_18810 [Candidatus Hydrogenedentota bacterium]
MTVFFQEDQRFRGGWMWVGVAIDLLLVAAVVAGLTYRVAHGGMLSDTHGPGGWIMVGAAAVVLVVNALFLGLLFATRLQIEVNTQGVFMRLQPFQRRVRQVDRAGLAAIRVVNVRPLRDYGGYGLRGRRNGKAYLVEGEQGVRFDYENGFHILLGSPRAEALYAAIRQAHPAMTGDSPAQDGREKDAPCP